jgi:hypothetical protein
MNAVDVVGLIASVIIGYALIAATVSIIWPADWPLRLLAAYVWPATLLILATDRVYEALFGEER